MTLENCTHVDAQRKVVVAYALAQQRRLDDILMVVVGAHIVATGSTQVFQNLLASQHFADGEWA